MNAMDGFEHEQNAPPAALAPRPGHALLLIVGAEPELRSVMRRMLARRGFVALEASNAPEAVEAIRMHGDAVAGVVLDLGMPSPVAEEIFGHLRAARADLPVLFTGGYGEEILTRRLAGAAGTAFLPKPFGLDALGSKAGDLFTAR